MATADIVRGEFLFGVHFVQAQAARRRGLQVYADRIAALRSVPHEPSDFAEGARLSGEARRLGKGKPGLADGILAATALRLGAQVATRNVKDFQAMGVACADPFAVKS